MQKDTIELRIPTAEDVPDMLALIRFVHGDDTEIDLSSFVVAVFEGRVVGSVRMKTLPDGTHRLASLAVYTEYRRYGVGSKLVSRLLDLHQERPIYVLCTPKLQGFYEALGFEDVARDDLPTILHEEYDRMATHALVSDSRGVLSMILLPKM